VDADGDPLAGSEIRLEFRLPRKGLEGICYIPESMKTDAAGRFRIGALFAGYEYTLRASKIVRSFGTDLRAGEVMDLGDVRMRRE
jgi:hypothetical protein